MNTSTTTKTIRTALVTVAALLVAAAGGAQAQDIPAPVTAAPAPVSASQMNVARHGAQIVGTMICGDKRWAITPTGKRTIGETIGGLKIVDITLDRVTLSAGVQVFQLDIQSGEWIAGMPGAGVAE